MNTTRYAPADTVAGDSLHWSDLSNDRSEYYGKTIAITPIDLACWSDYSGSLVEASNARVLLADPDLAPYLVSLVGSHGSQGVAYLGTDEDPPDALRDVLACLADGSYLNDSDHSDLEMETESAAWDSFGARDFRSALADMFAELAGADFDLDIIDDDRIFDLWRRGCDSFNVNGGSGFENENGDSIYFYIDEWITRAERDPRDLRADLIALAAECRIAE